MSRLMFGLTKATRPPGERAPLEGGLGTPSPLLGMAWDARASPKLAGGGGTLGWPTGITVKQPAPPLVAGCIRET